MYSKIGVEPWGEVGIVWTKEGIGGLGWLISWKAIPTRMSQRHVRACMCSHFRDGGLTAAR